MRVKGRRLLKPAELLVHADLDVLMSVAIAGLRAHAKLPRPVVKTDIRSTLALRVGQVAAVVHRAAGAAQDHVLFGREQDCLQIEFGAGHAILEIMHRDERCVERMLAVQTYPDGEIALDQGGIAIRHVVAARDVKMGPREQREIEAALKASEVEARKTAAVRRKRTLEAAADPQLVADRAAEDPDVRRDALLDLRALLKDGIFVADVAAAKGGRLEESGRLQGEESRIRVVKPLRMCCRRDCERAQHHCERGDHPNAGNSILRHVSPPPLSSSQAAAEMSHRSRTCRTYRRHRTCRRRRTARPRRLRGRATLPRSSKAVRQSSEIGWTAPSPRSPRRHPGPRWEPPRTPG